MLKPFPYKAFYTFKKGNDTDLTQRKAKREYFPIHFMKPANFDSIIYKKGEIIGQSLHKNI